MKKAPALNGRTARLFFFLIFLFPVKNRAQTNLRFTVEIGVCSQSNIFFNVEEKPMYRQFLRILWNAVPQISVGAGIENPYLNSRLYPDDTEVGGTATAVGIMGRVKPIKFFFYEQWLERFSESGIDFFAGTAFRTESPGTLPWVHEGFSLHLETKIIRGKNYSTCVYVEPILSFWATSSDKKRTAADSRTRSMDFSGGISYSF